MCGYSQPYVDSLKSDIIVLEIQNNQLINYTDYLSIENARLTDNNLRQAEIIKELCAPVDTVVFLQDTIYFKLCDKADKCIYLSKESDKISINYITK
jgi:hypothetical protein